MGLFSEVHAGREASSLEKVLLEAIRTKDPKIIDFCKKHIYPLYEEAVGETFGSYKSDNGKKINKFYEK